MARENDGGKTIHFAAKWRRSLNCQQVIERIGVGTRNRMGGEARVGRGGER